MGGRLLKKMIFNTSVYNHLSSHTYANKCIGFPCGFHVVFIWFQVHAFPNHSCYHCAITAEKMKFSIKDFFSKCDQIRSFLKESLMENFIFVKWWSLKITLKIPCIILAFITEASSSVVFPITTYFSKQCS